MAFSNVLPDPVNKITDAGVYDNSTGTAGPGFASSNFQSVRDTQVSRTISGRGVPRSQGSQHWEFNINYNEMTRDQFEPVFSFLMSRNGRRSAFYVALPEYARPRDLTFASCVTTVPVFVYQDTLAGQSSMIISHRNITGNPKPGDMFTISDPTNANHTKAYRVTRSENNTVYETAGLSSIQRRVHFTPPLSRNVSRGSISKTTTGVASNVFTLSSHGLFDGMMIRIISGSGLLSDTTYYVLYLSPNTFSISATVGGSAVAVSSNMTFVVQPTLVIFNNPKVRCILKSDIQEYSLNTDNLYNFSLSLEEIQP
jgi:hypothetical protein